MLCICSHFKRQEISRLEHLKAKLWAVRAASLRQSNAKMSQLFTNYSSRRTWSSTTRTGRSNRIPTAEVLTSSDAIQCCQLKPRAGHSRNAHIRRSNRAHFPPEHIASPCPLCWLQCCKRKQSSMLSWFSSEVRSSIRLKRFSPIPFMEQTWE